MYLIKNATIVNEGAIFNGNVLIDDELIVEVSESEIENRAATVIDARGMLLIPGVIDDQVHFREPGLTHKAEIYTEAKAAVAGGVTSFMEMPNTIPQTTTVEHLEEKYSRAADVSLANYSFYIGATNSNINEVQKVDPKDVCGIKCFMGSSTGNMLVEGDGLVTLFKNAQMLVATHCEDEQIIKNNLSLYRKQYGDSASVLIHPIIRSVEACYKSTSTAIELATKYGTRLHVLHLSTAREMELFNEEPLSQKQITAEVCVPHLWFDDSYYSVCGNLIKCNPAIKSVNDKLALRAAVNSGKIDVIATDHAPHSFDEKNQKYFDAPSGAPYVQHSLQMMLELVSCGVFTYGKVVEMMCHNPAELFHIEKRGYLRKGYKADIVLVDPNSPSTVSPQNTFYKCGWSPLNGTIFKHSIKKVFVNGNLVFDNGVFDESSRGERLIFNR